MKKLLAVLLVAMFAVVGINAAFAEGEAPVYGGDLVIGLSFEPDTMNVYSTHLMGDVQAMCVEGLLIPNGDMIYEPVLAKEVPTVENGGIVMDAEAGTMDIIYHLQENVYWHCGEKFTSRDVVATWETLKNPEWDAESKDGVDDIDSIECPDDYTVICHYNKITPDYAQTLFTFGIMPAHDIEGVDMNDENNGYNSSPCGTGPYMFSEWVAGEYIKLVRNENYWREGAYMDSLTVRFVTDENTRITMLKNGELDFVAGLSFTNYEQIANLDGYNTVVHGLNSWRYLDFNQNVPGLDDINVRRAMACAIDKEGLCTQLFSGIPQPWDQPWMPTDPFHVEGFETEWKYDLEKAAALLDEAGYTLGDDGVRVNADGVRLEYTCKIRSSHADIQLVALVVQSSFAQIGIKMNIESMDSATWSADMYAGNYELGMGGYITSPGAGRSVMYSIDGVLNRGSWLNQEFTDLMAQVEVELDEQTRKDLVEQCLKIFDSELPQVVLYANTEIVVVTDRLKGFIPNPTNMSNFCQMYTWYLAD